jgi:hypothetical protein
MSRKDLALIGVAALCLIAWLAVRLLPYGVLLSLIGVLLGAAISAGLSWYFYQQASDDLRNEAEQLRRETKDVQHYTDALITYLDAAGAIHPVPRDKTENPSRRRSADFRMLSSELAACLPRSRWTIRPKGSVAKLRPKTRG